MAYTYRPRGKYPGLTGYRDVTHNGKEYTIGSVMYLDTLVKFVINKEDFHLVEDKSWHFISGNYVSTGVIHDSKKKELYLHNLIMGRLDHPGKGAKESVDHINRNGLDNRRENLRILSQSNQNINQRKKKRNVILPTGCEINPEDIPKHVWYVRAQGLHGDRFAIEFKSEGIVWKTTSSKGVTLKDKLTQAKEKLEGLYKEYPHLNPENEEINKEMADLQRSFEEILLL
jgi:hypothetical protein